MNSKKRGLGRGLEVLLGAAAAQHIAKNTREESEIVALNVLPVDLLQRGHYQPRVHFDPIALQALADSLKTQGILQPLVVRPVSSGKYEILAGERRWRAAQLANLHEVPVVVRDISDQAALAISLIENIQREDLSPLEEAQALSRLVSEFSLTHEQAGLAVGRSRTAVSNLIRLLDLSEQVQLWLREAKLDMGHARALLPLKADLQVEAGRQVLLKGLTVRETEVLVRQMLAEDSVAKQPKVIDPNIRALQDRLADQLGARVRFAHQASGKGKMVIEYNSLDELDGILKHFE